MAAATLSNLTAASPLSVRLMVDGEPFDLNRLRDPSQAAAFQQALDNARHKYGHALCQCRPNSLKLQIRLREGKYHLAVWPEQGHMHDSGCIFFREEENGPATEIQAHVHEKDDGTREVKLNFALDRSSVATSPRPQNASRLSVDDHKLPEQASLKGLLHLLWQEANLTRWHPAWERDWGRARYELLQAAHRLTVKGRPLIERLFSPKPYRESIKEELNLEWDRFVTSLARSTGDLIRSALVVAPVRKFVALSGGGVSMHLRHLRSPIGLNEDTFEFLRRNCRTAVRRIESSNTARNAEQGAQPPGWININHPEVMAIAHVEANARGGIWARGAWLLPVHPHVFIPANNADEVLLIDALIEGHYQFSRLLTTVQPMLRTRPDWVVRHVYSPQAKPVPRAALEILDKGVPPEFIAKRADLADRLGQEGVPIWTWTPAGRQTERRVPPLPPRDDLPPRLAHEILHAMRQKEDVFYAYGSGREPIET